MFNFFFLDTAFCDVMLGGSTMLEASRTDCGVSAIWIFANLSFTAMRAQARGSTFSKVLTFIFGFPGTLLTLLVVTEGSERAYGIDMPRKSGTQ